ncbi:MAG: hypothetical protein WCW67_08425, partial [Candidatus Margulisiibacteriota bacterium]
REYGDGIYINGDNYGGTVDRNTLVMNHDGITSSSTQTVTVKNNIVMNQPRLDGDIYYTWRYSSGTDYGSNGIKKRNSNAVYSCNYNNVWQNETEYDSGVSAGLGAISSSPHFVAPWNGDYRFYSTSPCINAGEGGVVNIGAYDGAGEAGSPYRAESYIDGGGNDTTGDGSIGSPWRTLTRAARYTERKINIGGGQYTAAAGESFPIKFGYNHHLQGAGRDVSIINANSTATEILHIDRNSTIEGISIINGIYDLYDWLIQVRWNNNYLRNNRFSSNDARNIYLRRGSLTTIEANELINTSLTPGGYAFGLTGGTWDNGGQGYYIYRNLIDGMTVFYGEDGDSSGITNAVSNIDRNTIVHAPQGITGDTFNDATAEVTNNIISYAAALDGTVEGYGIYNPYSGGKERFDTNLIWRNGIDVYAPNGVNISNTISLYPRFVEPWNSDYRLYYDSPCIGTGIGGVNIGAYDGTGEAYSPYIAESFVSGEGSDATGDGLSWATAWRTLSKANRYTIYNINIGNGNYSVANGEWGSSFQLGVERYVHGVTPSTEVGNLNGNHLTGNFVMHNFTTIEGLNINGQIRSTGLWKTYIKNNVVNFYAAWEKAIYAGDSSLGPNTCMVTIEGNYVSGEAVNPMSSVTYGIFVSRPVALKIYRNVINNYNYDLYVNGYNFPSGSPGLVNRNTIAGKNSSYARYGFYSTDSTGGLSSILLLKNNIIYGRGYGTGVYWSGTSVLTPSYNDVYNWATDWNGVSPDIGDISVEPGFWSQATHDYHLLDISPNRASGTPAGTDRGAYDWFADPSLPLVTIEAPNGGEDWRGGVSYEVVFAASNREGILADSARIYYTTGEGTAWIEVATQEAVDAPYSWTTPLISTTEVKVRVSVQANGDLHNTGSDESNVTFVIDATSPEVTIISPQSGEVVSSGASYDLRWVATEECGFKANPITLYYSLDTGETWTQIASQEPNDGVYSWPVPATLESTSGRVRVTAENRVGLIGAAMTGNIFFGYVDNIPPLVTVEAPASGEVYRGGSVQTISFEATDVAGIGPNSLKIWYSIDSGLTYPNLITSDAAVVSPFSWTTPADLSTTEVRVKVTVSDNSLYHNLGTGESGVFAIDSGTPEVSIINPNGGETLSAGTTYEITWAATDEVGFGAGPITLRYSLDTGESWTLIASQEPNDSSYIWTVPSVNSAGSRVSVEAVDQVGYVGTAMSADDFTITYSAPVSPEVDHITLFDRVTGGLSTNQLTVSLEAFGVSGEPTAMSIAQDAGFTENSTGWTTFLATTEYTFTAGDGLRTAYYKVRNLTSDESQVVSDTILVDTVSPTVGSILLKDRVTGSTVLTNQLTVTLEALSISADAVSMRIAQDAGFTENSTGWTTLLATTEYTLTDGDGLRTAYYQVRDLVSNESNIVNDTILVDTASPTVGSILLKDRVTGSLSYSNELTISLEALSISADAVSMRIAQ